ncbi:MAG: crossover junction endodeoxyribonuclease RuvC [Oceanipulchritudo sp.]
MPKQTARTLWAARIKQGKAAGRTAALRQPRSASRKAFSGIVLGIDPSLRATGLAALLFKPPAVGRILASETVRPGKEAGLAECLGAIAGAVQRIIETCQPEVVAVEESIYVQNLRTAQKLGAARGAAIGQAALRGLPVHEYPPLRIKQAVVGYGRASKEQVSRQMSLLLGLQEHLPFDEADAAATALCHAMTLGRSEGI